MRKEVGFSVCVHVSVRSVYCVCESRLCVRCTKFTIYPSLGTERRPEVVV